MGDLCGDVRPDTLITERISSGSVRYISSLPDNSSPPRPAKSPSYILARKTPGGFGCLLWSDIQCGGIAIYKAKGIIYILKWVDDFLVFKLPGESLTQDYFTAITGRLGIPWAHEKTWKFASQQRYIGFDWNIKKGTVSLPFFGQDAGHALTYILLVAALCYILVQGCRKFAQQTGVCRRNFPFNPPSPSIHCKVFIEFPVKSRAATPPIVFVDGPAVDREASWDFTKRVARSVHRAHRNRLVEGC